ncbi:MAG: hypothetical protein JNJ54_29995, partial [Myxococcaceae bacterium]|nr:hypothetical protein [Myxococcaceae bacterium]
SSLREETDPSIALNGSTPSVLYLTGDGYSGSPNRPVIAIRTGPNTWTRNVVPGANVSSNNVYPWGELAIDSTGRHLFAVDDETITNNAHLVAWTPSLRTSVQLTPQTMSGRQSLSLAGANRLYLLGGSGLFDVSMAASFPSTTMTRSLVETFTTSQHVVATDAAGLPRLLVNHGSTLEVVRPASSPGFWQWTELGPAEPGRIDVSVDGANETRACFVRAGKLMLY